MRKLLIFLSVAAPIGLPVRAAAQELALTPNPDKWRPVVYRDLQIPGPLDAPFTGLWADREGGGLGWREEKNGVAYVVGGEKLLCLWFCLREGFIRFAEPENAAQEIKFG